MCSCDCAFRIECNVMMRNVTFDRWYRYFEECICGERTLPYAQLTSVCQYTVHVVGEFTLGACVINSISTSSRPMHPTLFRSHQTYVECTSSVRRMTCSSSIWTHGIHSHTHTCDADSEKQKNRTPEWIWGMLKHVLFRITHNVRFACDILYLFSRDHKASKFKNICRATNYPA